MGVEPNVDDRLRDSTVLQNTAKAAAGTNEQRNGRSGRQAFIRKFQNRPAREAPHAAERYEAYEDSDQERDVGIAQKAQALVHPLFGVDRMSAQLPINMRRRAA